MELEDDGGENDSKGTTVTLGTNSVRVITYSKAVKLTEVIFVVSETADKRPADELTKLET